MIFDKNSTFSISFFHKQYAQYNMVHSRGHCIYIFNAILSILVIFLQICILYDLCCVSHKTRNLNKSSRTVLCE